MIEELTSLVYRRPPSLSFPLLTNTVLCLCFSTSDGLETFSQFLRTEFSEENIEFWLACEEYKTIDSETKLLSKAKYIYTVFIESEAPKEVWHVYLLLTARM